MARDALRAELSGLKLSALRRRALADGVEEDALDLASDGADAKAAVVELVLAMAAPGPAPGAAPPRQVNRDSSPPSQSFATLVASDSPAGLDEGLLPLTLSSLLCMENPYSYKKCQ